MHGTFEPRPARGRPIGQRGRDSEEQARELIELIGTDWNAPLREAHFLKARH